MLIAKFKPRKINIMTTFSYLLNECRSFLQSWWKDGREFMFYGGTSWIDAKIQTVVYESSTYQSWNEVPFLRRKSIELWGRFLKSLPFHGEDRLLWLFGVLHVVKVAYCAVAGHDMVDHSYGGPESGCMAGDCRRCGYGFHVTLY